MHHLSASVACVAFLAACSATKPTSVYPPVVGPLPVRPMPEDELLGETSDGGDEGEPIHNTTRRAPAPVDAALPHALTTDLSRHATCTEKICTLKNWIPDPAFAKSYPGGTDAPAALWLHEIEAGSTVVLPRHSGLTTLGMVVAGSVLVRGDEGGADHVLGPWDAFRAPGAGCTVRGNEGDARVVLAQTTAKDSLAESLAAGEKKAWAVRWRKRPGSGAVASKKLTDVIPWGWAGGAVYARIFFGGASSPSASLGVLKASKELAIPEHAHDSSWEHLAVLSGSSSMTLGGKDVAVKAGDVLSLPKGTAHALKPGTSDVLVIQVYTPSGPEQRYRKLWTDPKAGGTGAAPPDEGRANAPPTVPQDRLQ